MMKKSRLVLRVDSNKLYEVLERAIENFKSMESAQLGSVDIEKFSEDYVSAVLIFNQTLFRLEQVDL